MAIASRRSKCADDERAGSLHFRYSLQTMRVIGTWSRCSARIYDVNDRTGAIVGTLVVIKASAAAFLRAAADAHDEPDLAPLRGGPRRFTDGENVPRFAVGPISVTEW